MRNENDCSRSPSNNSSPSPSNSSPSSSARTPKPPANAFRRAYLDRLVEREEATVAGTEAETRGPWKVLQLPPAGGGDDGGNSREPERWVVLRAWEEPEEAEPHGTARYREHALLWAAALEVASRGSNLAVGQTRDEEGLVISEWSPATGLQTRGHVRVWDEDAAVVFRVLDGLLRCPEALARLVDAGGAAVVELLGQRLAVAD